MSDYPSHLRQRVADRIAEIAPLLESLPGVSIIYDCRSDSFLHMSSNGLGQMGITLTELRAMTAQEYHDRFFNMEEAREYMPGLLDMLHRPSPAAGQTYTFFQQVRFAPGGSWNWYLSSVRVLVRDDENMPLALLTLAQHITPDQHYTPKIERLLDELSFLRQNMDVFSSLGKRERDVLRLLALGRTAPEIATELFLSVQTVSTHRKNIRRKLGAKTQQDLDRYARAFNLI